MPSLVGFIGIGNMGACMARNLLAAGYRVIVCDRSPKAVAALQQAGALQAETPAQLASTPGLKALVTMLPSSAAVRETYLGPTGIFSLPPRTLRPSLLIDSSTIDPLTSRDLAAAAARTTLHPDVVEGAAGAPSTAPAMLDAPVSGGVGGAAAGTLTFMVGGPAEAVARAQGLLGTMGRATVHCGEAGAGQAAKLCNNLVLGVSMAGVAEGLALGQRLGLDARNLTKIFNGSSARCWSADTYNPVPGVMEGVPASREYTGGFAAALMSKDLGLAQEAAAQCSAALPMTAAAAELYRQLATEAGPAIDFSGVYQHVYGGQAVAANS
ncbi:HID1 [Auxenochlorella protothecoides x Auxenochlorella symbiontica]|uniref:3-hydroxyisobutyrate dehydrogenase n=2 Tax=Auxenochlorella protothecoides TaxID=3075 RepID=A0A3M7KYL0_AUXPR|nr:hypothetical protein APUTEX25_003561 [Auxenochlorella protothecoides]|eukprot:RMZ55437.1 hypothetical protein APUTEX25_003561 [Auxenochlorella protothecoides]